MENLQNQIKYKQIRTSSSQLNIKPNYKNEDLVFLINSLNSDIKSFYQSVKKCIYEGKQNIYNSKVPSKQILDSIEQYLYDFINKAKDIFKKMKYTQKINIIQQELNDHQNNSNLFLDDITSNKMKLSRDNLLLNNNFDNISIEKKNFMDKNFVDEVVYSPSLCNNNTGTSIKINNYFDNNNNDLNSNNNLKSNDINEYSHKYKKVNDYSINNNKISRQTHNYGTNYNIRMYKKCYNNNNNPNNFSDPKIMFHNYNQYNNNPNKKKKTKSVHELRKKILMNKKSLNHTSNPNNNYYSTNNTLTNFYSSKKDILNNINDIISILKELKSVNDNIFKKTWEAEQHQKLLNKIYYELNILIKNIFKENNISINSKDNILISEKDNYLSENISDKSLIKIKDKIRNNSSYSLTYNFETSNNNDEDNDNQNSKKANIYYDNEIKARDLIIKKLKNELNMREKNLHNNNIKYNKLKSKLNYKNEDDLKLNNMSKVNVDEFIENKRIIMELEEKLKKYEKNNGVKSNNFEKLYHLINQKYNELKKKNEIITLNNGKLKEQINLLYNKFNINKNKKNIFAKLEYIKIESLSITSKILSEETQKIINDLKNELQTKAEINEKCNNDINTYKNNENNLKEEISKLNNDISTNKLEIIKLKEEISNLNNEISKYKEDIIKIKKENESLEEKKNLCLNENKSLQETIDKQKKLLTFQEDEIKSLKNKNDTNKINDDINIIDNNDNDIDENSFNNINKEDKKNKKRNNIKQIDQLQIEQDKIVLKYELLKNDYDKLNSTLQQKQKLLDNYSKLSSETSSKTNIDEQVLELISEHKKEIDNLTKKYNQNIISLKMNLPIGYSPSTHCILIDKKYSKYNLKWFLLTITTTQEKNYENTFWVPEDEIKPMLSQFNKFRTEKEIEDEQFESIYITQQKWIKQIDENEQLIAKLKTQLQKYENSSTS